MKCGQRRCEKEAAWTYVWTAPMAICDDHLNLMLTAADSIGFSTPRNTLQPLKTETADSVDGTQIQQEAEDAR